MLPYRTVPYSLQQTVYWTSNPRTRHLAVCQYKNSAVHTVNEKSRNVSLISFSEFIICYCCAVGRYKAKRIFLTCNGLLLQRHMRKEFAQLIQDMIRDWELEREKQQTEFIRMKVSHLTHCSNLHPCSHPSWLWYHGLTMLSRIYIDVPHALHCDRTKWNYFASILKLSHGVSDKLKLSNSYK